MKKKILIVEDEIDLLAMLEIKAKNDGYDCFIDTIGDQTITLATENNPDLILLDMMLPKISGLGILRAIKNSETLKNIPVIIFSALGDKYVIEEAMDIGASAYFIKGGNIHELFDTIREYIT
ncbi:MAG: response regulator [bacterium]|nr:response regulator [bacterium]MBU1918731.1 response regulator [bacterium]